MKRVHKDKDVRCGPCLSRSSGSMAVSVNVLDLLLVIVQEDNHGATSPDHET